MNRELLECRPAKIQLWRYWLRMAGINVLAAITVVIVFSGVTTRTPLHDILVTFSIALLFSFCIGPLLALAMPLIAPAIWGRFAFPLNWMVAAMAMIALAMAGSVVALGVLLLLGVIPGSQFAAWFAGTLRVSIIITLTFGIFATAVELLRSRLDEATLALRTKERDEAQARQLAAEAQFASLESRVHPHFLFNTLNSIAALIPQDPAAAERVVGQLASLLRFSLDTLPLVPLDRELQVVGDYLDIERVRFGERLRYRVEVDEGARDALVPRLSVQTLVENSVKYAVSTRRDGASILVAARVNAGDLALSVADDGPGFEGVPPDGHGLALLQARLAAQFGDRAALTVDRERPVTTASGRPGATDDRAWTRVTVRMPLRLEAAVP